VDKKSQSFQWVGDKEFKETDLYMHIVDGGKGKAERVTSLQEIIQYQNVMGKFLPKYAMYEYMQSLHPGLKEEEISRFDLVNRYSTSFKCS
jgi:hypothetical protein